MYFIEYKPQIYPKYEDDYDPIKQSLVLILNIDIPPDLIQVVRKSHLIVEIEYDEQVSDENEYLVNIDLRNITKPYLSIAMELEDTMFTNHFIIHLFGDNIFPICIKKYMNDLIPELIINIPEHYFAENIYLFPETKKLSPIKNTLKKMDSAFLIFDVIRGRKKISGFIETEESIRNEIIRDVGRI